jgi:Icc-related predicted phosphoesterase
LVRLAHVSDVHTLADEEGCGLGFDVRFVSFGRELDGDARTNKLRAALAVAKRAHADHVLISGDLTETGTLAQFERFAESLHASGWNPDAVTLVPGNHDAYTSSGAWKDALDGPLRPWAYGAAREPGKIVEHDNIFLVPIDVSHHQSITRSTGLVRNEVAEALERRLIDPALARKPILFVQHHPPYAHAQRVMQWFDGLRGWARIFDLLVRNAHVHLMHGHWHRVMDRIAQAGRARIFGAPAVVEDERGRPRVRMYELRNGELESLGLAGT